MQIVFSRKWWWLWEVSQDLGKVGTNISSAKADLLHTALDSLWVGMAKRRPKHANQWHKRQMLNMHEER